MLVCSANIYTWCHMYQVSVCTLHSQMSACVSFCLCFYVSRYWFLLCLLYFISRTLVFNTLSDFMCYLVYWPQSWLNLSWVELMCRYRCHQYCTAEQMWIVGVGPCTETTSCYAHLSCLAYLSISGYYRCCGWASCWTSNTCATQWPSLR